MSLSRIKSFLVLVLVSSWDIGWLPGLKYFLLLEDDIFKEAEHLLVFLKKQNIFCFLKYCLLIENNLREGFQKKRIFKDIVLKGGRGSS